MNVATYATTFTTQRNVICLMFTTPLLFITAIQHLIILQNTEWFVMNLNCRKNLINKKHYYDKTIRVHLQHA